MHRYFLHLAYDGAAYCGWQRQLNSISIQQCIEEALETILHEKISIVGAGRTDTGVHSLSYYAHFDIPQSLSKDRITKIPYMLNGILRNDIVIYRVFEVPDYFHARFSAENRAYKYYVHLERSPFKHKYSCFFPNKLDFTLINEACEILKSTKDFTSFSKLHTQTTTNLCNLMEAKVVFDSPTSFYFYFKANRFLRNMVRAMVGTLLEVGSGKYSLEQFSQIVDSQDRGQAGRSVAANALFLTDVAYF